MKRSILALVAILALVFVASCKMPEEDTSLEGTWVGETSIRVLTYKFNYDGTFNYTLKDKRNGRLITEINGTWEIEHEGYLHMNAPITTYVSRYDIGNPRYVFIYIGDPANKLMYFGASNSGDPNEMDVSYFHEYEYNDIDTYTYGESTESDDHGILTTTESAKRFKFEDALNRCTVAIEDRYEYENGTYNKSIKSYTYYAEDPSITSDFICYRMYDEVMVSEEEDLTYAINGKYLTLGPNSQIYTKQ